MRIKTIWTLRGMRLSERLHRTGEAFIMWIAHHLPRRLAYYSFIDTGARHIGSNETVPEVTYTAILKRASNGR